MQPMLSATDPMQEGTIEEKIGRLTALISACDTTALIKFLAFQMIQMENRDENSFIKGLGSPLRQLMYAGDLAIQTPKAPGPLKIALESDQWEADWEEIKQLLIDIESVYFKTQTATAATEEDQRKLLVAGPMFMTYYYNGNLSYHEQNSERIERTFSNNRDLLSEKTGITAADILAFREAAVTLTDARINNAYRIGATPSLKIFVDSKGQEEPDIDNLTEEEKQIFADFKTLLFSPGDIFMFTSDQFPESLITKEKAERIFSLLSCSQEERDEIIYYTQDSLLMAKPLYRTPEGKYILIHSNQFFTAAYDMLFGIVKADHPHRAYKQRDQLLEQKVLEVLQRFFGKEAHFYTGYYVDGKSEQDILMLYKGMALIIEVKSAAYRGPLRDLSKAYERLASDFKASVGYAYEQTWRVKKKFLEGKPFDVCNEKGKVLYTIQPNRYTDVFSVIVTLERLGLVQSDLSLLLKIEEEDNYPWSICVDDLEVFLLALRREGKSTQPLRTFLTHREAFHDHVFCTDELELCAYFMINQQQFIEHAYMEETIATDPRTTEFFEKYYTTGLGFSNERHLKEKRSGKVGFFDLTGKNKKQRNDTITPIPLDQTSFS